MLVTEDTTGPVEIDQTPEISELFCIEQCLINTKS